VKKGPCFLHKGELSFSKEGEKDKERYEEEKNKSYFKKDRGYVKGEMDEGSDPGKKGGGNMWEGTARRKCLS